MHLASDSAVRRRDERHAGHLRDLRPALPRRPLARCPSRTRSAASCSGGSSWTGPPGVRPAYHRGEGSALLDARPASWASRASSPSGSTRPTSRAGARSSWLKIKNVLEQDVVIGGWTPGEGGRSGTLGALAVGVYDGRRADATPARSGTGFTEQTLGLLQRELEPLRARRSPVRGAPAAQGHGLRGARARGRGRVPRMDEAAAPCARPPSRACATTRTRRDCVREDGLQRPPAR